MATSRHFSRYTGGQIPGADQYGNLHIGNENTEYNFGEIKWWNGPDEELGYIIAHEDAAGNHIGADGTQAFIGFWRSELNDASFIELANTVADGAATFTTGDGAKTWLNANGYWTSYGEGNITFVTDIQTYSVLCRMPGDTSNWGLINLNYESNTASVRPLGLSRSEWSREDFYPLNESGYMLVFDNTTSGDHKILFLDAAGNTVQTVDISGTINYDVYQGKIMAVRYEGGVWYFDGLNVYQYTHPTENLNYTEVLWDNDATSSNGTFMYKIAFNDGSTLIEMLHGGTALTIAEYDNLIEDYEVKLYDQADYYVIIKKLVNGVYQDFKIRKISDNTQLHSVDLTGFVKEDESPMEYRDNSFDNYSISKFVMVIHNWNDSGVDYRIYTYNGTTDVLNSTSHVKGVNYPNFNMITNTGDRPRPIGVDSFVMSFSSNSNWNGSMNTYAYFDIVYQMSWQTSLTTYVFTDAGVGNEVGMKFDYDGLTDNYHAICTTNNTDLQVLSITEADGLEITTIGLLADFHDPRIECFGNKACLRSYAASDYSGMILKYFGNTGGVIDELTIESASQYDQATYKGWNIFAIKHNSVLYQINTTTDEIVTIGPWSGNHDYTSGSYYEASTSERQGDLVHILVNEFTQDILILKPNTYATGTLASSSDYDLEVGKDSFMYIFEDPNSGNIQIDLYDFNLTLLNSIVTDKTNFNFSEGAIKDRFYARHNDDNGTYTWYMITPTFDDSIMTSTSNTSRVENDWVYWD